MQPTPMAEDRGGKRMMRVFQSQNDAIKAFLDIQCPTHAGPWLLYYYMLTLSGQRFSTLIRSFNRNLFNIKDEMSGQNMFP